MTKTTYSWTSSLAITLLSVVSAFHANAQNVWIGGVGNWDDPMNWDQGTVPSFNDDVEIMDGEVYMPPGPFEVAYLFISGGILAIDDDSDFEIFGGIENTGGTILNDGNMTIRFGNFQSSGIFNEAGSIVNDGTIAILELEEFYEGIYNSGSFTNNGTVQITGDADEETGIFNTGPGDFTNNGQIMMEQFDFGVVNGSIFDHGVDASISIANVRIDGWVNANFSALLTNRGTVNITDVVRHGLVNRDFAVIENVHGGTINIAAPTTGTSMVNTFNGRLQAEGNITLSGGGHLSNESILRFAEENVFPPHLDLSGDLLLHANSTFGTFIFGNANAYQVNVTGDVSLDGTLDITLPVQVNPGPAYTILTYTGSLTGTFATAPAGWIIDYDTPGQVIIRLAAMPIELSAFSGKWSDGVVKLDWTTRSEVNNDYFILQRSDGEIWKDLEQIKGAGNSSVPTNYEAWDSYPLAGISYYRLMQFDFDRSSSYSNIVAISSQHESQNPLVYPNPVTDKVYFPISDDPTVLGIFDAKGHKIYEGQLIDDFLDLSTFANGIYTLRFTKNKSVSNSLIVKM